MSSPRLLVVLSSDPEGPVVRYRWLAFRRSLAAQGVVLEVVDWPKERDGRRRALHRASTADGVVVSSRLLKKRDARDLRRRAPRLALDFDDALPFRDSSRGAKSSCTRLRRFRTIVTLADRVFAGNDYLAGLAEAHGTGVDVLPTVLDVPDGEPSPEPPMPPPVLGWIGSRSTLPYLESAMILLSAVVASGRPFKLRVIADGAPMMPPGIAVEAIPWTDAGWRDALAGIHIGVAPLPDDAWTRGKCGFKILQMMSVGRPVVASAVGVQRLQVRHGVTGYLGETREQLFEGLLDLVDDPDLRRRMGRAAWEEVRASWSVAAWAPRVTAAVTRWLG